eukprot:EG_transcript_2188
MDLAGTRGLSMDADSIFHLHGGPSFATANPLLKSPPCARAAPAFSPPKGDRSAVPNETSCSNSFGVSNISQHSIAVPPFQALPSAWACLAAQPLPWGALLLVTASLSVGVFVLYPAAGALAWYPLFYAGTSLLALAAAPLLSGLQTRALLRCVGPAVTGAVTAHFADADPPLVGDCRIQFIQWAVAFALRHLEGNVRSDVLGFIRRELDEWAAAEDGHLVADPTGVIVWANAALLAHFGYGEADLEGENLRLLMPSPYRQQHDHFLRRHAATGERCMLGHERLVPVVLRDGRHEVLPVLVRDRTDPGHPDRRLFVGRFRFNVVEDVLATARAELQAQEEGEDLSSLCRILDDATDGIILATPDGTILYSNDVLTSLLQWTPEDLQGRNVKVLLPEPLAHQHDGFLKEYQARAEAHHQRGLAWPASSLVESGRDVACLTRDGQHVRVFMALHRMDRRGGAPCRSLFLARILTFGVPPSDSLPGNVPDACPASRMQSPHHLPTNPTHPTDPPRSPRLSSLGLPLKRRCTVVMLEVQPPALQSIRERHRLQEAFLHLLEGCAGHKGAVYSVLGDQGLVTFNAGPPTNSSHRASAAAFMTEAVEKWTHGPLCVAASTGDCRVTQWGHRHILSGDPVDLCASLLVVASEVPAQRPIIDGALQEELCYSYLCRPVNAVARPSGEPGGCTALAYQLLHLKEMLRDEWMYEVAEDRPAGHYLRPWERCWRCLPPRCAPAAANYAEAAKALDQFLAAQPDDRTALWLRRVLLYKAAVGHPGAASLALPGRARHTVLYYLGPGSDDLCEASKSLAQSTERAT